MPKSALNVRFSGTCGFAAFGLEAHYEDYRSVPVKHGTIDIALHLSSQVQTLGIVTGAHGSQSIWLRGTCRRNRK